MASFFRQKYTLISRKTKSAKPKYTNNNLTDKLVQIGAGNAAERKTEEVKIWNILGTNSTGPRKPDKTYIQHRV